MTIPAPRSGHRSRWLTAAPSTAPRTPSPATDSRLRLFCFHHAGGSASSFGAWQRTLGPVVDVLPVQLPGREGRAGEPRMRDVSTLVDTLAEELGPMLRPPYACYGHSMGALVAYTLTRRRESDGASLPERLLVGAYPAPHLAPPLGELLAMPDDQVARWLVGIGGMAPDLLRYPAWSGAAVELLKDDLTLLHSYRHPDTGPLSVPIDVFTGAADPILSVERVVGWRQHSRETAVHTVPGGHFFVRDDPTVFFQELRDCLLTASRAAAGRRGGSGQQDGDSSQRAEHSTDERQ